MLEEDGNNLNVMTKSIDEEITEVVPKKTTSRAVERVSGSVESGVGRKILTNVFSREMQEKRSLPHYPYQRV